MVNSASMPPTIFQYHGCGKGGFSGIDDRSFIQHFCQCSQHLLMANNPETILDLNESNLPEISNPRDRTEVIPVFALDRFQTDGSDEFRGGLTQSTLTLDGILLQGSLPMPATRETFTYPMEDEFRWELNDEETNNPPGYDENVELTWQDDQSVNDEYNSDAGFNVDESPLPLEVEGPYQKKNSAIPTNAAFTIELSDILKKHGSNLKLQDDVTDLINAYTSSG